MPSVRVMGLFSQRPTAATMGGYRDEAVRFYYSQDTAELYTWNKLTSAWNLVNGVGGGSSNSISVTAGEALSGHRAVYVGLDGLAYYASPAAATAKLLLGVTLGAAALGAAVTIQFTGIITEPSWTWGADFVWLAAVGNLTQVPPVAGYIMKIGVPVSPTKLRVDPQLIAFA